MKKHTLYLSLGILSASIIVTGIAAVAQKIDSRHPIGRSKPPAMTVNDKATLSAVDTCDNVMVFGDDEKEYCLGYLSNFKNESLTGSESPDEAKRITRKNELIQEYKAYVGKHYGRTMTNEEYRSHYDHLMEMFQELLTLEPEPTPQEQLLSKAKFLRSGLDDELTFGKRDEHYRQVYNIDLPMLETLITHLKTLQKQIENGEITYEQSLREYEKCLEELKIAHPRRYESVMNDDDE